MAFCCSRCAQEPGIIPYRPEAPSPGLLLKDALAIHEKSRIFEEEDRQRMRSPDGDQESPEAIEANAAWPVRRAREGQVIAAQQRC